MSFLTVIISNPIKSIKYLPFKLFKILNKFNEYRWVKKDSQKIHYTDKVLFVDLGSNLGQGYKWFKKFYNQNNVYFELFEPNPYCAEKLKMFPDVVSGQVKLHEVAAGTKNGVSKFYGISDNEFGKHSEGGTLIKEHASDWYQVSEDKAITIKVINFSDYILDRKKKFNKIIVKMDIEGSECDLLEDLIYKKSITMIDILYVECHSKFQS